MSQESSIAFHDVVIIICFQALGAGGRGVQAIKRKRRIQHTPWQCDGTHLLESKQGNEPRIH